jgi:hypothetical protein
MYFLNKSFLEHYAGPFAVLIVASLITIPSLSYAATTYHRSPSGVAVNSSMTFTFSFTDPAIDFPGHVSGKFWCMDLTDEPGNDYGFGPVPITERTHTFSVSLPPAEKGVWSNVSFYTSSTGVCDTYDAEGFVTPEGTGSSGVIFSVGGSVPPAQMNVVTTATSPSAPVQPVSPSKPVVNSADAPPLTVAPKTNFTRDLSLGSTGADVRALQVWLNTHGYVIVSSGPGSLGNETTYFGERTRQALVRFQQAQGITPTAGYFGPKTRGMINAL